MVPREWALQVPAVRGAANLLGGLIGGFALTRWKDGVRLDNGPLLNRPEDYRPRCRTIAALVQDLMFFPNAWAQVVRRSFDGYPIQIRVLEPEYVSFQKVFGTDEIEPGSEYAYYKQERIPRRDLICFPGLDEGFLAYGREVIMTALAQESAARTYATPGVPTGYLKQEGMAALTEPEIDKLLDRWERQRRKRATGYVNAGVSYHSVMSSAADMQAVEAREETAAQVGRMLNIPPRFLSLKSGGSRTYSNIADERADLLAVTLGPYMDVIEGRLSMSDANGTPRGVEVRFDRQDFAWGSPMDRANRIKTLVDAQIITPDEGRAQEKMPPRGVVPDAAAGV